MRRRASIPVAAIVAACAIASCGGERAATPEKSGAPTRAADADRLVAQSAGRNVAARSGRIDGSVEIALRGVREFREPFSSSFSGPFVYRKGAALPDYKLDMGVRDYGVTLSSVRGKSYVSLGDSGYVLPPATRRLLVHASARGRNGLTRTLEQFGIAPWRWETDRHAAATERIDGAEVLRIETSFNAGRIIKDANTLLGVLASLGITRAVGLPRQIPRHARKLVVTSVTSKTAASWIGVADHVLRRATFTMRFAVPAAWRTALGGISGGTIVGRLDVTEVGKPQHITPPKTVAPSADLALAIDALGDAREN